MEKLEKIERYLRGAMSPVEAKDFEQEVAANAALAHEVEMTRFEMDVIGQLEADALREKIKTLRQEEARTPNSVGLRATRIRWWAAVAAAGAVLIAALFLLPKTVTPKKLVVGHLLQHPDDYSRNSRAGDVPGFDPHPIEILKRQDASKAGDAVRYFQSFTSSDSALQMGARLNLAHALLLADDTGLAIQVFKETEQAAENDASIREAAQFYGALAVLQNNDIALARRLLETIAAQPAHRFQSQAAELLPSIEKI